MTELRECPFCPADTGKVTLKSYIECEGTVHAYAYCVCGTCGPLFTEETLTEAEGEATKAWNTRHDDWRQIESAPRDLTSFLGYSPKYHWVGTVRFDLPNDKYPEIGTPNYEFITPVNCTHWKPLPQPPKE